MIAVKWSWAQSWDKAPSIASPRKPESLRTILDIGMWRILRSLVGDSPVYAGFSLNQRRIGGIGVTSVKLLVHRAFCLVSVDASFVADWNSLESLDSWLGPGASDMDGPVRSSLQNLTSFTVRNVSINPSPSLAFWTRKNYIFTDVSKVLKVFSKEPLLYSLLKDCGFFCCIFMAFVQGLQLTTRRSEDNFQ